MSLKSLIKNQKIIIDDHKWGSQEIKDWDNSSNDIHIDKETKYKIEGVKRKVKIRLPINSNNDISIEVAGKGKSKTIPRKLKKEIANAFSNKKTREAFVKDLIPILENFQSNLSSIEKARKTLSRIAKHFDLEWDTQEITNIINGVLLKVTQIYQDKKNNQYYITIDNKKIIISNVDNWFRANNSIIGIKNI